MINKFFQKNGRDCFLLALIFTLAIFYRFFFFPQNIYFGFDQARDAFISRQWIENHSFKLFGPPTDLPGVFHGPLYYYLIGPLYVLSHGDPALPFAALMVLNALGIFLIYFLGKTLFSPKIGIIAALLYALSFEQYQYSFYAADPSPGVISILIFYLGCALFFLRRKRWGLVPIAVGLATAIHFEFFLGYLMVVFLLLAVIFRKPALFKSSWTTVAIGVFVALIGNYLLAEVKYRFRMTTALLSFLGLSVGELPKFTDHLIIILEKYVQQVYLNLFGFSIFFSGLIFLIMAYFLLRKRRHSQEVNFLFLWILGPVILYFTNIATLGYFMTNIGVSAAFIILASYGIFARRKLHRLIPGLLIILILAGNLKLLFSQGKNGLVWGLLAVQTGMMLEDEKRLINFTYRDAQGLPFTIRTLSMPLKIQTTWAYLYGQFGQKQFGYLPYFDGENISSFPGRLPEPNGKVCQRYVIIEPLRGVASYFVSDFFESENRLSKLVFEKKFGALTVQKRLLSNC